MRMHAGEPEPVLISPLVGEILMIRPHDLRFAADHFLELFHGEFDLDDRIDLHVIFGREEKTGPAEVGDQVVPIMKFGFGRFPIG